MKGQQGSVLVGLLWCLALLGVVVVGVLHTARMDLTVQKHFGDRIQARYLALAGVEKAKALLYRDARERSRTRRNHGGDLYDAPRDFREVKLGRGQFSVLRRGRQDEGGGILYGVSDEEGLLNVNYASLEELGRIEGLTPDIAAAIVDWRDEDNQVTPGGAEAEFYTSLLPPYRPRNGAVQTVRELLMVRGITRELLFGTESRSSRGQESGDPGEAEELSGGGDTGWASLLTVNSSVNNVNAAGDERVDVQNADERALTGVAGITADIARAIVARRNQNRFESIADLLDVTAANRPSPGNAFANPAANPSGSPEDVSQTAPGNPAPGANSSGANTGGPKLINSTLLMDIADDLTVQSSRETPGLVNINSAGLEVLLCLPGLNRQLAQAIISYRQSSGYFPNPAWLLKVPGISAEVFKQVAPRVCARSETFRIMSEGRIPSSGARQRVEEIVHVGLHSVVTLSYREDDL